MFHFLEARIATMLRTSRGLLRWSRRHLMKDLRKEEWIVTKLLPALEAVAQRGDVDAVMKDFRRGEEDLVKLDKDLDLIERNAFLAEYSSVKQVDDLSVGFARAIERIRGMRAHHPEMEGVLDTLERQFTKMREELQRYEGLEMEDLHKQYLAVGRQAQGEHAQLQSFVFAANSVMKAMDDLWHLRGQIRRERKEEKDLDKGERHVLSLIAELEKASPAKQKVILAQLRKQEHRIEEELDRFLQLFKHTEEAFTLVLKVCVDIYLKFDLDQVKFSEFMKGIQQTGFPVNDFGELVKTVSKAMKERQDEVHVILDVVRRGARLQGARLAA